MGIEIAVGAALGAAALFQQTRAQNASERNAREQNKLAIAAAALDRRDDYEQRLLHFEEYEAEMTAQRSALDLQRSELRTVRRQSEADRLSREATYADRAAEIDAGLTEAERGQMDARNLASDTLSERSALKTQFGREARDLARDASADSAFQRVLMAASGASGTASQGALVDAKTAEHKLAAGRLTEDFRLEDNVLRTKRKRALGVVEDYADDMDTLRDRRSADKIALNRANRLASAELADTLSTRGKDIRRQEAAMLDAEKRLQKSREQARESYKRSDPNHEYYEDIVAREEYEKTPAGKKKLAAREDKAAQKKEDIRRINELLNQSDK